MDDWKEHQLRKELGRKEERYFYTYRFTKMSLIDWAEVREINGWIQDAPLGERIGAYIGFGILVGFMLIRNFFLWITGNLKD